MTISERITIYTPESPLREPGKLLRSMFRDLLASRELAWRLFLRNNSAQYRQTILGYLWAFLPPVATSITFVFLASQKVVNIGNTGGVPYIAFVLIGTTLWQTFVDAINAPIKIVQSSKAMLAKINFPREALLLAGFGEVLFNFAVRSLILVATVLWFQLPVHATLALVPIGVLALIGLGLMLGLLLTPFGLLYQDIGRGLIIVTGFWMLLTPIVYPVPKSGAGAIIAQLNPVSPLVICTREWLTQGATTQLAPFLLIAASTLVLLFLGWIFYRLTMPIIIERMGG